MATDHTGRRLTIVKDQIPTTPPDLTHCYDTEGCLLTFPHDPDLCWTEADRLSGVPRLPPPSAPSPVLAAWRSYQLAAQAFALAAQAAREAGRPFHVCDDCGRCPWECEGGCCDCIPF